MCRHLTARSKAAAEVSGDGDNRDPHLEGGDHAPTGDTDAHPNDGERQFALGNGNGLRPPVLQTAATGGVLH